MSVVHLDVAVRPCDVRRSLIKKFTDVNLETSFSFNVPFAGPHILINTGVMEPIGLDNIPVNVENLDIPSVDRMVLEREDLRHLER